ncbi:MAG: hypothetical protein DRN92_05240 [Thermoproteota archaeon]|nr:MAG: hypothetical protein DRN92_05240 [Candidatus Korarchaeota archaeon]
MTPSKLKGDPIKLFWDQASCWRKLVLLRLLDVLREDLAQKYLKEIAQLQNPDGGFSKNKGETSRVTDFECIRMVKRQLKKMLFKLYERISDFPADT